MTKRSATSRDGTDEAKDEDFSPLNFCELENKDHKSVQKTLLAGKNGGSYM